MRSINYALVLMLIGCGGSGGRTSVPANPNPPLKKMTDQQKETFLDLLTAEGRLVGAQSAVESEEPDDLQFEQDDELEQMRELLKRGDCKARQSQRRVGRKIEIKHTVEGADCPIAQSFEALLNHGGDAGGAGDGRLTYTVKTDAYRSLNDIDGMDLRVSGKLVVNQDKDSASFSTVLNLKGTLSSVMHGELDTAAGLNLRGVTLKDKEDGAFRMSIWQRIRIKDFLGEIRLVMNKSMGEDPRMEIWLNGERQSFESPPEEIRVLTRMFFEGQLNETELLIVRERLIRKASQLVWQDL